MSKKVISPYSFSVKKDGRNYEYQVMAYPYRNPLAGGICNSRRDAERCARQDIARLELHNSVQQVAA